MDIQLTLVYSHQTNNGQLEEVIIEQVSTQTCLCLIKPDNTNRFTEKNIYYMLDQLSVLSD